MFSWVIGKRVTSSEDGEVWTGDEDMTGLIRMALRYQEAFGISAGLPDIYHVLSHLQSLYGGEVVAPELPNDPQTDY